MRINYLGLKGIVPITPKIPEEANPYVSGPIMIGMVGHDSDKLVEIIRLSRLKHEPVRRITVVEDNDLLSQILDDAKVYSPSIVKSLSEEIQLLKYNMDRQASESQTKDFISEKQKEHWLKDRVNRPSKHYNLTRNKMK